TRFRPQRTENFRPGDLFAIAPARRTHVNDVVVVLDRIVFGERRRIDVENARLFIRGGRHRCRDEENRQENQPSESFHRCLPRKSEVYLFTIPPGGGATGTGTSDFRSLPLGNSYICTNPLLLPSARREPLALRAAA